MQKAFKKVSALAITILISVGLCATAFAINYDTNDFTGIDISQTGSITLEMKDTEENTITDGEISVFQIEELGYVEEANEIQYILIDDYIDCDIDGLSESEICDAYAEWTKENNIEGVSITITDGGIIKFSNLPLGVYLVMQTKDSEGYYTMNPFLVTVPNNIDNEISYDVEATPKMRALSLIVKDEPVENNDDEKTDDEVNNEEKENEEINDKDELLENKDNEETDDGVNNEEKENEEINDKDELIENKNNEETDDKVNDKEKENEETNDKIEKDSENTENTNQVQTSDTMNIVYTGLLALCAVLFIGVAYQTRKKGNDVQ